MSADALLATALCLPLLGAAPPTPTTRIAQTQQIVLETEPVPLNRADPAQNRIGALTYAWGLHLKARGTSRFGGLSGLDVASVPPPVAQAGRPATWTAFTVVSDDGDAFRWVTTGGGRPAGGATALALRAPDGRPLAGKAEADAEGLAETADGYLVSFERDHRIWAYRAQRRRGDFAALLDTPRPVGAPPTGGLPPNEGFEALAAFAGNGPRRLAVGAEDGRIWLCTEGAACTLALTGAPEFGYRLTGLDALDGTPDLVAVYRFYNPFTREMRALVAHIPVQAGRARVVPLARLARPLTVDNMEGVAAVREGAGWRLYLLSDDNFSADQRTLLLAFDWTPQRKGPASPPAPVRRR
jgi:hypothetical protein